ncbi:MAG: sensor histidine kinase [Rhodanobacter sp.]
MSLSLPVPAWLKPVPDSEAGRNICRGHSPWFDAIHLLWSIWLVFDPLMDKGFSRTWVVSTILSYPVFLLLYALCIVRPEKETNRYATCMAILSFALIPWNQGATCVYFVYSCVMTRPGELRMGSYLLRLGVIIGTFSGLMWLDHFPWKVTVYMVVMVAVITSIIYVSRIAGRKDAALKLSQDEVRRLAATAERERIGRDLHDLLGHTLSLITLKLELSRKLFDRDVEAAKLEVAEAEKVARHALAEVRSAVTGFRATDLAAELASARLLLESSGVQLDYDKPPSDLPGDIERGLSLVLREAVTNIARHANASRAKVEMVREHTSVRLQISDNGRGGIDTHGNGLNGMRERVRALGGSLSIESPRGQGTRLRVVVPVSILRLVETPRTSVDVSTKESTTTISGHPAA